MLDNFNVLSTTSRGNEDHACTELKYLFGEIGDDTPIVDKTGISGLLAVRTTLDPLEVVKMFRRILGERPYEFRYTLRVIPIEKIVETGLAEIRSIAATLSSKIREDETFRVTVEKRCADPSTKDIIDAAAADIKRRVDLDKPDKILLIEVVGGLTGVSVIKPDEVLSVLKEKML